MKYWIERWVQLRKKELIAYPNEFPIHDVYTTTCTLEELKSGFRELHEIFTRCYEDILTDPADMLLPTYDMNEYGYFSKEARMSREESYKYAKVLYVLGYSGELKSNGELCTQADKLKEQCKALKITNIGAFLNKLGNYGFTAEGLVNGKIKSNTDIIISYPENRFGNGADYVSDILSSEQDRETAQLIHDELIKRNYFYNFQDWNEGSQIRYYKKESDMKRNTNASFWLASMDTELRLYFRIANMEKAVEYIKNCPESVINNFSVSDSGCSNRFSGKCASGISYQLGGKTIWRCGCCNPNFQVTPTAQDYL